MLLLASPWAVTPHPRAQNTPTSPFSAHSRHITTQSLVTLTPHRGDVLMRDRAASLQFSLASSLMRSSPRAPLPVIFRHHSHSLLVEVVRRNVAFGRHHEQRVRPAIGGSGRRHLATPRAVAGPGRLCAVLVAVARLLAPSTLHQLVRCPASSSPLVMHRRSVQEFPAQAPLIAASLQRHAHLHITVSLRYPALAPIAAFRPTHGTQQLGGAPCRSAPGPPLLELSARGGRR